MSDIPDRKSKLYEELMELVTKNIIQIPSPPNGIYRLPPAPSLSDSTFTNDPVPELDHRDMELIQSFLSPYRQYGYTKPQEEETDMEIGKKGDKYEREFYAVVRAGDQYLVGNITTKERLQLLDFARGLYKEDPDIMNPIEFGMLMGIGLILKRSLE